MTTCPHCGHPCDDHSTYTVRGAAVALGVTTVSIRRMLEDGRLVALASNRRGVTAIDGDSVRAEAARRHTLT